MNAQTRARLSTMLVTVLILVGTTPVCAVDQASSPRGEMTALESTANHKVNINTASLETLTTLKGVGPQLAQRITEFRQQNGPFQKPEDIMQVKGVGTKVFDQNRARIVVE